MTDSISTTVDATQAMVAPMHRSRRLERESGPSPRLRLRRTGEGQVRNVPRHPYSERLERSEHGAPESMSDRMTVFGMSCR